MKPDAITRHKLIKFNQVLAHLKIKHDFLNYLEKPEYIRFLAKKDRGPLLLSIEFVTDCKHFKQGRGLTHQKGAHEHTPLEPEHHEDHKSRNFQSTIISTPLFVTCRGQAS